MRYTGPKVRLSRRAGTPLTRKAVSYFEKRPYPPGEHGRRVRRNSSDYAVRQAEKQKVRWYYDLTEKQMLRVYESAKKRPGRTGEEMLAELELRLATVVLRAGLAASIYAARQFVNHGHVKVNGQRVNIASYRVKEGDVVAVRERSRQLAIVLEAVALTERDVPDYLEVDHNKMTATFVRTPALGDVPYAVQMEPNLVVEFYAKN